jgi:serine/threonine protein kinase
MSSEDGDSRPTKSISENTGLSYSYADFQRLEIIGQGGNADVYRAETEDGRILAIKEPRVGGGETIATTVAESFAEEARTWARLDDHEHIVDIIGWGTEPLPWIAMEYMDAGDLSERIENQSLELEERFWIILRIINGVEYAHSNDVVHLDIKPGNILFQQTDSGEISVPKVADWGLAKLLGKHSKSVEELTPEYAAPEQFESETYGGADERTDVYQLGVLCYELIAKSAPFEGTLANIFRDKMNGSVEPPSDTCAEVPTALDDILVTALAANKDDRFDSAAEFREQLQRVLNEETDITVLSSGEISTPDQSAGQSTHIGRRQLLKYGAGAVATGALGLSVAGAQANGTGEDWRQALPFIKESGSGTGPVNATNTPISVTTETSTPTRSPSSTPTESPTSTRKSPSPTESPTPSPSPTPETTTPVNSGPSYSEGTIIEGFGTANSAAKLSQYGYRGDMSVFSKGVSETIEDPYSLEATSGGKIADIQTPETTVSVGHAYDVHFRYSTGAYNTGWRFLIDPESAEQSSVDDNSGFMLKLLPSKSGDHTDTGEAQITRGGTNTQARSQIPVLKNRWIRARVELHTEGRVHARLYDMGSSDQIANLRVDHDQVTDGGKFESGAIGWWAQDMAFSFDSDYGTAWYDHLVEYQLDSS